MASQFNQFASEKTKLVYFCRLAQQIIACFDFYYFVKNGVTVSENRKKPPLQQGRDGLLLRACYPKVCPVSSGLPQWQIPKHHILKITD